MDQLSEEEIQRTVEVRGLPEDSDQDDVYGYFENPRFGGGEIEKLQFQSGDEGSTLITFKDEAVIDKLLAMQTEKQARINRVPVDLRRCEKPKPVQVIGKEVVVSGIPGDWAEDDWLIHLENQRKFGGKVLNVVPAEIPETFFVKFADQSVAEKLVEIGEIKVAKTKLKITWPLRLGNGNIIPEDRTEKTICPHTIAVENFPEDQLEHLQLNLESRRKGGGKLESMKFESDGTVVAKFDDESVAARFLERGTIKIGDRSYPIVRPPLMPAEGGEKSPDFPNTIEVSGISEKMSEEYLKMYFENKRSGGGEIKTIHFSTEEGRATITFKDPKAVHGILDKGEHKIGSDAPLQVIALESLTSDLIDQVRAIRVTNIPSNMSRDLVECHFESEKRSGGEEYEEVIHDEDGGSAIFIYKSLEVRKRVVGRAHMLDSVQLTVEALQPAPPPPIVVGETDEKKLLIGNLITDFKEVELKKFLENTAGSQVTKFTRGSFPDVVLLDFKSVPKYLAIRKLVVSRPFKSQMISVQKVKPSASVIIYDAKSISEDMIALHFENTRRSGGGEVKNVRRNGDGDIIVEFADRNVIPRVLTKKQEIEHNNLKMGLYNDYLFQGTGSSFQRMKIQIPEELVIPVDDLVLRFLSKCTNFRDEIEAEMQRLNCAVQWQMPDNNSSIKLSCTLTPKSKNLAKLVVKWDSICTEQINTLLDKIVVKEENLSSDIWGDFAKAMKDVGQSGIICEFDQVSCTLRVIGGDKAVGLYMKNVTEIRNDLQAQLAKRKSKTYKSITLKKNQLKLLRILELSQLGFSKDVNAKVDDQQVSFEGCEADVSEAMLKIYELVNNQMQCRQFPNFDPLKAKFLQKKEVADYLTNVFQRVTLRVVWNFVDIKILEISGMSDTEINKSFSLMDSEILYKSITLDVNQIPTVKETKWNEFNRSVKDAFKIVDIQFDLQSSSLTVFSNKDNIDLIIQEIGEFLNQNTILEQLIPLEDGRATFIDMFKVQEIRDLEKQLAKETVIIELMLKKKSSGILVRGTKTGIQMAVALLDDIQQQILSTHFESDAYVSPKFFSTTRGQESIDKIQSKNKVIIDVSRQPKNFGTARGSDGKLLGEVVKGPILKSTVGIKSAVLKVLKGNLTECQAKVLVIPVKEDLKHTSGIAKAVVNAGGQTIEDECQAHVKTNGKLLPGQIYTSKAGKLVCSAIIHIALPKVKDGKQNEVDCLFEGIYSSLSEAKQRGWSSIAISGSTGFPPSSTAKAIVEAVDEFLTKESSFPVDILLIDSADQVVNHLHEALVGKFGKEVKLHSEKESLSLALPSPINVGTPRPIIQTKYKQGKDALTLVTPEGMQVTLIQGSIAAQKVDVIMNTASKELNLTQGAVSNSIQQVAGPSLQAECKQKAPNGLKAGEIISTSGYNLGCKHVYHGVCESWDAGKGASEQIIRDLLKKTFQSAHQTQMTSVAIPALGTGNLGFPKELVCAIMYEEAELFSKSIPLTTVKDVRFVVFDDPTVKAFQEHVKYLSNPHAAVVADQATFSDKKKSRQLKSPSEIFPVEEKEGSKAEADIALADDDIALNHAKKTIKIKSLLVEIVEGDITQESTDAIVNSTNKDLNLSGGDVSKALISAGGPSIAKECKRIGRANDDGIAVTGSGNLKCKVIIHLAAPDASLGTSPEGKTWEQRVFNCLKEAERLKFASIAFPLLGTGALNISPVEIAVSMLNAVGTFSVNLKPKHLKTIRVCIFQPKMVDEFFTAISKKLSEKKPGIWGKLAGWWSSLGAPDSKVDGRETVDDIPSPQQEYQTIFKIFGLSQGIIDRVMVEIEELMKGAVIVKVIDIADLQESIAKLTPEQIKKIESDAAGHQVIATVDQGKKINRIRLQGNANDITDVTMNVMQILREVVVEALKRNEAERIAQQVMMRQLLDYCGESTTLQYNKKAGNEWL